LHHSCLFSWLAEEPGAHISGHATPLSIVDSRLPQYYGVVPYSPLCYAPPSMSHAAKNKEKLIVRARRIRGQVEALERALTEEQDCGDILRLITSARGAMNSLMVELLEDQIRFHVLDPDRKPSSQQAEAADGLVETIKSYLK
jgi:DNA-binding FrmR family transcriptional regulator